MSTDKKQSQKKKKNSQTSSSVSTNSKSRQKLSKNDPKNTQKTGNKKKQNKKKVNKKQSQNPQSNNTKKQVKKPKSSTPKNNKETPKNPHLTSWKLSQSPYNPELKIVTFYHEETPLTHFEISAERAGQLTEVLNTEIGFTGVNEINKWYIRQPDDTSIPPLLHLESNSIIVGSVELNQPLLKQLVPALQELHKTASRKEKMVAWYLKHKKLSWVLGILVSSVLLYSIISYM